MYHVVFSEVIAVVVKGKEDSSKGPEDKEGGEEENQNQPTVTHDAPHSEDAAPLDLCLLDVAPLCEDDLCLLSAGSFHLVVHQGLIT